MLSKIPPPYGGVTIFASRIYYYLQEDKDFEISMVLLNNFSISGKLSLIYIFNLIFEFLKFILKILNLLFFSFKKKYIFHYNGCNIIGFIFLMFLKIRHGNNIVTIGTIHGHQVNFMIFPFFNNIKEINFLKIISKILLKYCDGLMATNHNILEKFSSNLTKTKVEYLPCYIPFKNEQKKEDNKILYELNLYKKSKIRSYIFSIWKIAFHNKVDLYGLDIFIEAFAKIINCYPEKNIGAIIHIGKLDKKSEIYLNNLLLKFNINRENIFLILNKNIFTYLLVNNNDVFVRPTYLDGGPISLYEIQHISPKATIVASDCAKRIDGIITFRNRSAESLFKILKKLLNNPKIYNNKINFNINCYGENYKSFYKSFFINEH